MAKNILALVDFSEISEKVVAKAGELASLYDAKCWIVHIAAPDPDFVGYSVGPQHERDHRADILKEEHAKLQDYKNEMEEKGITCDALLIQGDLPKTTIDEANKLEADLIIIGSHGRSQLYELLVGSVAEYLLRNSDVPVLVMPK